MPRRRRINPTTTMPQVSPEHYHMDSHQSPLRPISPIPQTNFLHNPANQLLPAYRRNFLQISLPSYIRDLPIFKVDSL